MTGPQTTHSPWSRRILPPEMFFRLAERCLVLFRQRKSNGYDRLGRQVSAIVEGVSTNLYAYDALSLTNETVSLCASAPLRETISRATDALGRSLDGTYAVAYGHVPAPF